MPRNNELGNIRRSQVITTFGPGAIVDFAVGGPISVVAAGIDVWDERAKPAGLMHPQTVFEPRLQDRLKVKGFRLPPVTPQIAPGQPARDAGALVGVRFPRWLQCPECHRLKEAQKWSNDDGDPAPYCQPCSTKSHRRVHTVPVRFVMACENGHLDEFPWHYWVGHKPGCKKLDLRMASGTSAGLAGLILECPECGARRPMEGVFSEKAFPGFECSKRRPWLPTNDEQCDRRPRVVLRGASNLYFPVLASALDIPPWSERIQAALGVYWEDLKDAEPGERPTLIKLLKLPEKLEMTPDQVLKQVNDRIASLESGRATSLRWEEYVQLTSGEMKPLDKEVEFEMRVEKVPPELSPWVAGLSRVVRLREVRALLAFTRIHPPSGWDEGEEVRFAPIQQKRKDWLPATEVRGEGIFIRLRTEELNKWESKAAVQARIRPLDAAYREAWAVRHGAEKKPNRTITPRLVLIHSLAHALMRQLSLECGYSSASLRERLYVGTGSQDMAGLLIYTATPDSDGTLGGLCRQGEAARMLNLVEAALQSMAWCSSDPLCISGLNSMSESLNIAACHACLHAPETSCEEFNRVLDRATLVGTPRQPELGYFQGLLRDLL